MSNEQRDELAKVIRDQIAWSLEAEQGIRTITDAILAAGYVKLEPLWAETLENDGTYEYTSSSDCDGSNVIRYRRTPTMMAVADASPWKVIGND